MELLVDLSEVYGPEIDLETSKVIESCAECQEFYSSTVGRMESLEQSLHQTEQTSLKEIESASVENKQKTTNEI